MRKHNKNDSNEVGMNIKPQTTQPISDDQELAKVLAGVNDDAAAVQPQTALPPTPPPMPPAPADDTAPASVPAKAAASIKAPAAPTSSGDASLDAVKKDAITELRPLVDKLNIAPDEKFDTYLLLIRSTDDRSLIAPAHEAAKAIPDEGRRAQALLDIIKEIDYLSNPQS